MVVLIHTCQLDGELNIPAAIGIGSITFNDIINSKKAYMIL